MKNVQVIDGAVNCSYEVFAITNKDFALMFPAGAEIEFISDFVRRVGEKTADRITKAMWERLRNKNELNGIHGTLFYELDFKKEFYPTRRNTDLDMSHAQRQCCNRTAVTKAAENGDANAQYQLAAILASGDGLEKDTEKAAYWYRKAAAKKHPEAMYNLGLMYLLGETKRGTREKGHACVQEAADLGSWDANWFLGQAYLKGGYGLKKDEARAALYLTHALGCKYANAALALGLALKSSGDPKPYALPDAFIHVAARAGNKEALDLVPLELSRKFRRRNR
jgi:TPR repeat protein